MVSHTCLDQIRAHGKWKWAELDALDLGEGAAGAVEAPAPNREERDLLFRVLERVPQECRQMWRMIVIGLSYKEMSLRLKVAEGTLRVRVLRCREKATAMRREILGGQSDNGRNVAAEKSPSRIGRARLNDL